MSITVQVWNMYIAWFSRYGCCSLPSSRPSCRMHATTKKLDEGRKNSRISRTTQHTDTRLITFHSKDHTFGRYWYHRFCIYLRGCPHPKPFEVCCLITDGPKVFDISVFIGGKVTMQYIAQAKKCSVAFCSVCRRMCGWKVTVIRLCIGYIWLIYGV